MDVKQMSPEMTKLIRDLGISYDPERLKEVLRKRGGEVRMRAIRVSAALAAFLARIVKVLCCIALCMSTAS